MPGIAIYIYMRSYNAMNVGCNHNTTNTQLLIRAFIQKFSKLLHVSVASLLSSCCCCCCCLYIYPEQDTYTLLHLVQYLFVMILVILSSSTIMITITPTILRCIILYRITLVKDFIYAPPEKTYAIVPT